MPERQALLPFDPPETCRHTRAHVSTRHRVTAEGRVCNHDVTCEVCGAIVAVESWTLIVASAARQHAEMYP